MQVELGQKVLVKLATSDHITIAIERQPEGKMRVTSNAWDSERVLFRDQVVELRHGTSDGQLHVSRKMKAPDDRGPTDRPYDPNGQGVTGNAYDVIDD